MQYNGIENMHLQTMMLIHLLGSIKVVKLLSSFLYFSNSVDQFYSQIYKIIGCISK